MVEGAVLFIQQQESVPGGLAEERARAARLVPRVIRVDQGAAFPDPRGFRAVVVLGSSASVYDSGVPWIPAERAFVGAAVDAGVPVLGICFGGQLLASVLGGEVRRSELGGEVGWAAVESAEPWWLAGGPWVQYHFDVFTVPPGAAELARSAVGPQAFRHGRHLGLQFHPEVDEVIAASWASDADKLSRLGVAPDAFDRDAAGWAATRANANRLFDTWFGTVVDG